MKEPPAIFGTSAGMPSAENHWTAFYHHPHLSRIVDHTIYDNMPRIAAELETTFALLAHYAITPTDVLNLACGPAPHHILGLLARFPSCVVVGVDSSPVFVARSKHALHRYTATTGQPDRAEIREGDMRALNLGGRRFDVITLYGNSFGYFSDAEHQHILTSLCSILRSPGVLLLTAPIYEQAAAWTTERPCVWHDPEVLIEGERYSGINRRFYNPQLRRSLGEHHYMNAAGETICSVYSSCALYRFESSDDHEVTLFSLGRAAGFAEVVREPFHQEPTGSGLMSRLEMVVFRRA